MFLLILAKKLLHIDLDNFYFFLSVALLQRHLWYSSRNCWIVEMTGSKES